MYETVKEVKGYKVTRMVGTHGFYWVRVSANKAWNFRTIKAAVEFINKTF